MVFDPFGGSGTVGKTAKALDRLFFLTEQKPVYFEYMQTKTKSQNIFNERKTKFFTLEQFKETAE
ncbi:hypothetical protein EZS27_026185 [termite gut metagenome]|uniref:DNA methylase N-4/N-6 domain-containing protein n=1 Tax=termite gut metagenome TaxID=433724 RepID=A0A5J4QVD9_9ZZZZ